MSADLTDTFSGNLPYSLITIKKRKDFQATSGGLRFSTSAFTLLRRVDRRAEEGNTPQVIATMGALPYRFGFTVTKKLGNAVVRNRIRRRVKAAVVAAMRALSSSTLQEGVFRASMPIDFVILARGAALTHPFEALCVDFTRAITRLSGEVSRDGASEKPRRAANSSRMHAALGKSPAHRLEGNETE